MVKRLIIVMAGILLLVVPSISSTQAAVLARKSRPIGGNHPIVTGHGGAVLTSHAITGTLTAMSDSVLTLNVSGVSYTIDISSTTKIVRRYNGHSNVDELSVGDQLAVTGAQTTTNTIAATVIKDLSIQEAWTRMSGSIKSVSSTTLPATMTVTVVRDRLNAPFTVGQNLSLAISASTAVISPTTPHFSVVTGTAALPVLSAATGTTVTVLGVFNKVQNAFTTVYRIRLHGAIKTRPGRLATPTPTPGTTSNTPTATATSSTGGAPTATATATTTTPSGHPVTVAGTLESVSSTTAPAVLTVQTAKLGLITVNIGTSPAVSFTRRFNGTSSLDELSIGDQLSLQGSFTDTTNKTLNATSVKDLSIQDAATRAVMQITQVTASGFVGTVVTDNSAVPHPFNVGDTLTVTVSSSTKIMVPATAPATGEVTGSLSNLTANQTVTVMGVFNRPQNTFTSTQLVTVHR